MMRKTNSKTQMWWLMSIKISKSYFNKRVKLKSSNLMSKLNLKALKFDEQEVFKISNLVSKNFWKAQMWWARKIQRKILMIFFWLKPKKSKLSIEILLVICSVICGEQKN